MQEESKKNTWETTIIKYSAIAFAVAGLMVLIFFLLRLKREFSDSYAGSLDMAATGQTGDFIGGFIGALWSFAGVLLFYLSLKLQREELDSQLQELKSHRIEFQIGRFTNVVYNQI